MNNLAPSIATSLLQWTFGIGAIVITWQGGVAFILGCIVTVLTIYKIILDIQIRRRMLRSRALAKVAKQMSEEMPVKKQHDEQLEN